MVVRVDCLDVVCKIADPLRPKVEPDVVFLAKIPPQGVVMAKPCDDLAVVKLSLDAQFTVVELFLVWRFGFVKNNMQEDAATLGMGKNGFPLT